MMAEECPRGRTAGTGSRQDTWHIPLNLQDAVELQSYSPVIPRRVLQLAPSGRDFDFVLLQQITQSDETYLVQSSGAIAAQLVIEESAEQFYLPPRAHTTGDFFGGTRGCWRGSDARFIAPSPRRSRTPA